MSAVYAEPKYDPQPPAGDAFAEAMKESSPDRSAVLRCEYEGDLVTLRAARRAVVDWLAGLGADDDTRERAALIVSELSSNAIQAAPGRTYSLQLARVDDWVCDDLGTQPPNRQCAASARIVAPRAGDAAAKPASEGTWVGHRRFAVGGRHSRTSRRRRRRDRSRPNRLQRVGPLQVDGLVDNRQHIRQTRHFQQSPHPIVRVDQFVRDTAFLRGLSAHQDRLDSR